MASYEIGSGVEIPKEEGYEEHKRRYLRDLREADNILECHFGPKHIVRMELERVRMQLLDTPNG